MLQSVLRGPQSAARSQALINDRVRAVTQKALSEEQPLCQIAPHAGAWSAAEAGYSPALLLELMIGQL